MQVSVNLVLSSALALGAEPIYVHGVHYSSPMYARENQAILDLPEHPISDTHGHFADAFEQNRAIEPQLQKMVSMPYFSTYKVDLSDKRCPLEDDTATCAQRACAIEPSTSADIDENSFHAQYLGRLRKDSISKEAPAQVADEGCTPESMSSYASSNKNYCYPEDESLEADGVWVDSLDNAERYTGYEGAHAGQMWANIYGENCFGYPKTTGSETAGSGDTEKTKRSTAPDFGRLGEFNDASNHPQADEPDLVLPADECVEQRLFYKLISGMHASISTHSSYDWMNTTTKEWGPNLNEWVERVGWHEDRMDNMFFDYVIVSRAVAKSATNYERQMSFSPTCQTVDADVRIASRRSGRLSRDSPLANASDEQGSFSAESGAQAMKDEFRRRVRNVNALMSCVGCERCRLWGKIQTAGYGTASKISFESPENPHDDEAAVAEVSNGFRRSELVALINTFARISHSIAATDDFRSQVEASLVSKRSFRYQARQIWSETSVASKFILRSYIESPKNSLFLAGYYFNEYWSKSTRGHSAMPEAIDFNEAFHAES